MRRFPCPKNPGPFVWCAAIICAIVLISLVSICLVLFICFTVVHPRIPIISVVDGHLDFFRYDDIGGVLQANISLSIQVHNTKANTYRVFDEAYYEIRYEVQPITGIRIGMFEAKKEGPMVLPFLCPIMIQLNPPQRQALEFEVKRNLIRFEIIGASKTWWQFGLLRLVKLKSDLRCELRFTPSNGSYIPSVCTSSAGKGFEFDWHNRK
ncbi:PREDICTED: uncharacterized protein LOC104757857 [Camelina sativa]|uniref:Uncharacterized protein LOC104757857 n=1 Tax=Camelina sativa TaxID=90675 RepID=A0ABM0X0S7_CAMSA|nr:PREDICTED: uncharacterized protein LOC104757857 [Camelina sativa]